MLTQHNLFKLVLSLEEYDIVVKHSQDTFSVEESLDLPLKVSLLNFFPVEKVFPVQVPSDAVEKINQVGSIEELVGGYKLRRLAMISAKLVNSNGNGFFFFWLLVLSKDDGDAIDEKYYVSTIGELAVCE